MRSITLKMVFAFLGLALFSIVLIVLLARWNTGTEFSRFVSDRKKADLVESLEEYYRETGSWEGVGVSLAIDNNLQAQENGPVRKPFFTLADETGQVVSPGVGYLPGDQIQQSELEQGISIEVDSERVGTLIMGRTPFEKNPREEEFIRRTNLMLLYSALGASIMALLIGIFLSRTLTRPIRELTEATQAVAEGNLGSQVSVRSKDEMGELAASFNKMSADLARSTESRKQMTADIAHELRTPLSLILGHADAVHDGVLPPTKENFEIIHEEAVRLEQLVEDLRILSLADSGELALHLQPISPAKLLKDLQTRYQHEAGQKRIAFILDLPNSLPSINVDPGRMTQVLTNIIDNALNHTPEGGKIKLSASEVQDNIELSVQDSGSGIEDKDINRIFDRFYRADKARNRDNGGSGLGLAIAKSIVLIHGGQIWAVSKAGQGFKVMVTLPIETESGEL